jgi:hypothetical protein
MRGGRNEGSEGRKEKSLRRQGLSLGMLMGKGRLMTGRTMEREGKGDEELKEGRVEGRSARGGRAETRKS